MVGLGVCLFFQEFLLQHQHPSRSQLTSLNSPVPVQVTWNPVNSGESGPLISCSGSQLRNGATKTVRPPQTPQTPKTGPRCPLKLGGLRSMDFVFFGRELETVNPQNDSNGFQECVGILWARYLFCLFIGVATLTTCSREKNLSNFSYGRESIYNSTISQFCSRLVWNRFGSAKAHLYRWIGKSYIASCLGHCQNYEMFVLFVFRGFQHLK